MTAESEGRLSTLILTSANEEGPPSPLPSPPGGEGKDKQGFLCVLRDL
jgi:hypothetical protein